MHRTNCFYIGLVMISMLLPGISQADVKTPKNPKSAKGCAICHYRWIDTFFIEGRGSDLVEYHSEKVVATPEMCISCHDGSVMDSRAKLNNDSGHKTNMKPPDNIKIPEIFPLDEAGKVQCATCHTAHGVPSGTDTKDSIFMRTSNTDSAMCRMCHPGRDGGLETGNHPVGTVNRKIPSKMIDLGAIVGKKKDQVVCETCHTAHGSPHENFLIDSAGDSALCLDCHRDKEIFTADGKRKPYHVLNVVPQKAKIPQRLVKQGAKLGFNGVITCQTCHKVHNNKIKQTLLLVKNDARSTLCLTCHADKHHMTDTQHNLAHSAPKEKNLDGKTAAEAGVCSACHLPHRAARKLHTEKNFTTQLCLSCHGKRNIAKKVDVAGSGHPLTVSPFEKKDTYSGLTIIDADQGKLTLPLFNKFGARSKKGLMTCSTCHNPHGTRADSLTGKARKDVKADKKTYFLREQAPDICGECHRSKFSIANSKHDLAKVRPASKNTLSQTPSEAGLCGNCHVAHGGRKGFLWARELEMTEKEGGVLEDLCVSCHNEKGLAGEKVIKGPSHPVGISPVEKGLNTSLPLFGMADKISKNGVMTCGTCHDPHRWDPLKKMDAGHYDIEGSAQNSFLRLENSPDPKLCQNCHTDKAYVEGTDHDLRVTAPFSKNIIDQIPAESGVCGVCHLVHNSGNQTKLWAQSYADGSDIMERMCNSCHSEGGSAKNRIPRVASHPKDKLIINAGRDIKGRLDFFPIFHQTSGKLLPVGDISCPSCHNAHQWDSRIPAKGKGVNLEGNATTSFLRSQAMRVLCLDCHGPDALLKIKFFHDPSKRTN